MLAAATSIAVAVACGDDSAENATDNDTDGGPGAVVRADARTGSLPDAQSAVSTMRFAHLAAETGPVDFCYQAAHAGTFIGPVLGGPPAPSVDAGDAGDADADIADASDDAEAEAGPVASPEIRYGTVTKYLVLNASGPLTVAIVEAGATSCANPIAKGDVTLDPGKLETLALFSRPGDGGVPVLDVGAFTDDRTTSADKIRVRVIHAALGTSQIPAASALAVRASGAQTTVLADRVEPHRVANASDAVMVDALGYVTASPIPPPATITVGPAATDGGADAGFDPWLSKPTDLGLTGGSLHTAFILPNGPATFEVLWCVDTSTDGDRTVCRHVH